MWNKAIVIVVPGPNYPWMYASMNNSGGKIVTKGGGIFEDDAESNAQ